MQRRAVAVYVALFLLVGTAAGVLLVTAETPAITFDDPDFELSADDTFEVDGQEYTVADITESEADEDGEVERSAQVTWVETTDQSETWANESTVELDGDEWRVHIEGEEPTSFTLVEMIDRDAILADDPNAANETYEEDGEEFVVVTDESGERTLVPADDYFPAPTERSYAEGDEFDYDDRTVTVADVTESDVTLEWTGPEEMSLDIEEGNEITLGDTDFIAHFPDGNTLVLSSDFTTYEAQLAAIDRLDQQHQGIWRVFVISVLSSVVLMAAAFVPTRY